MTRFKNLLAVLFVFVLAVIFAAPAKSADKLPYGLKAGKPYKGVKLVHLVHNAAQAQAHNKRTGEFTELTGIEVEYQMVPFPSLREKITADGVAGSGDIDLYCFLDMWGPSSTGFMVPLNKMLEADGIKMADRYPPAYINGTTYNGKTYGLPWRGHPQLLLYRTDLFEKAGVKVPTTWKELIEASKTIKEKTGKDGIAMYYGKGNSGQNLMLWYVFMKSNGSDIFDDKMMPIFNNDKGIEATQYYLDLMLKYEVVSPGSKFFREYEATQAVAQDHASMVIVWWWHYGILTNPKKAQDVVTKNIGFAPVPSWEGRGQGTLALSMATGISAHSKNKEAAWEFLKWLSSPELEKAVVLDKSDPKTMTIVAVHNQNLIDPEINKSSGGMHAAAAKSLAVSDILPMIEEWPEVANVLTTAISNIAGGADTKKVMDKAAKEVKKIMKRAGY